MCFRLLTFAILILSFQTLARSPAVEDFVGIEVEQIEATPHGSETLFNLEQDLQKIEIVRQNGPIEVATPPLKAAPAEPMSAGAIFGIALILGLPLISWLLVMNHLRQKATIENASNIEILEKYRKQRELSKKETEEARKAS
jgi:hypothetical protein